MPAVPGLRSPYATLEKLVYVGRMFDKIRLHARGELPADYVPFLSKGLDGRACAFLRIDYAALRDRVLAGGTDAEILAWAFATGGERDDHVREIWSQFLIKLGWNDDRTHFLVKRLQEEGMDGRGLFTFFDWIEADEGRDPTRRGQ